MAFIDFIIEDFYFLFQNWEKQEDEFHLHQARLRSSIRIKNGRAKPIDLLAVYINPKEENLEIQMHEPYAALVVNIFTSGQNRQKK